jgi:excisionase family DNA binding protein
MTQIKKYLTVGEVAEILNVTNGTIYKNVHFGRLVASKLFKRLYFDSEYIYSLLEKNKTYSSLETELEANTYSLTKKA